MINQPVDPNHFMRRARQIKARMPLLLTQWGLLPRFKRWRLAQDPETNMVVLFGVLNNKYIALHTTTPFSDYFDPRLLSDLSTELHVQVISSANDGLRYAFVLESGQLSLPPASTETSEPAAIDPAPLPAHQPDNATLGENQVLQHQRLARFLQITDVLNNNANTQAPPDVLLMDQAEFNQQMADFEAKRELSSTQKSS